MRLSGYVTYLTSGRWASWSELQSRSVYFQPGDKVPSVELFENTPKEKVNLAELFAGKKGVLFAVPGAFTPGCSKVSTWTGVRDT